MRPVVRDKHDLPRVLVKRYELDPYTAIGVEMVTMFTYGAGVVVVVVGGVEMLSERLSERPLGNLQSTACKYSPITAPPPPRTPLR